MPQPIRTSGGAYRGFPKHLLERPMIAALIGTIACEWAYVEHTLRATFDIAHSPEAGMGVSSNPVAIAIFETIVAFPPKLDLIERVLRLCVPTVAEEFKELRPDLRKAYGVRNLAVHTFWQLSDAHPDDVIMLEIDGKAVCYAEKDFANLLDRIVPVRNRLHDFHIAVAHAPKIKPSSPKP
jgi:hypothetical protein